MPIAKVRGLSLKYEIVGKSGPLAVLITGGRRDYSEFKSLASRIAVKGYRVLLHDRRNTGASDISFDGVEVEEAVWADDLFELLNQLGSIPCFIGGASSGARTALNFCIRHPEATRALLLLRLTGGEHAARRLTESYYAQFIRLAQKEGMEAICDTEQYQERFRANPGNLDKLMAMDVDSYIEVLSTWMTLFEAVAHFPVMGLSDDQLEAIDVPTMIIPGNDLTHSSASAHAAHRLIGGSELHVLPVSDQDVPLIPFTEWEHLESEIADTFTEFMNRH